MPSDDIHRFIDLEIQNFHESGLSAMLVDILRGADSKRIFDNNLNKISEFGSLKEMPRETIQSIVEWMIKEHYILKTKEKYPVFHSTYEGLHYSETLTEGKHKKLKKYLEEVKRNDGFIGRKPKKSEKAEFPMEALEAFSYQEDKPITRFVEQINSAIDENRFQKISYKPIRDWLKLNEFLEERVFEDFGKSFNVPTEKGEQLDIRYEVRKSMRGVDYIATVYGKSAQEYIVKNLEKIIAGEVAE